VGPAGGAQPVGVVAPTPGAGAAGPGPGRRAGRHDRPARRAGLADTELWAAIRDLSDRQAEVVLLLWFEDRPAAEVARTLGCSEDTVRTHWRRARARLAEALGVDDEEDPA
jgi:DNA-directed RNA polymerase specialized sigma24 family protein